MRELKFRALVSRDGKEWYWVYYGVQETPLTHDASWNYLKVQDLQYTGLKDKNGMEIYEGDILKHKAHWSDYREQSIVRFKNKDGYFSPFGVHDYALRADATEVIGNIYENPELLSKTE